MTVPMLFSNNATSRLTVPINAADTSINVQNGHGALFPQPAGDGSTYFTVTMEDRRSGQIEIMKCTARAYDVLTVQRGQEGTRAQAFAMGATISNRLTAGTMDFLAHSGATGPQGPTGPVGPAGPIGPAGKIIISDTAPINPSPGEQWWESDTGQLLVWYQDANTGQWVSANSPGPVGPTGAPGPTGSTGPVGPAGPATPGPAGPPGQTGSQGPQGIEGPRGPEGPAGPTGQQGAQGIPGASGVQVMSIGDLPPANPVVGQTWFESDTGNSFIYYDDGVGAPQWVPSHVGALPPVGYGAGGIPEAPADGQKYERRGSDASWQVATVSVGPQGPQGPQGLQGVQGNPGPTGPTGPTGLTGPAGATGAAGTPGATGPTGPTGAAGAPGTAGAQGPQGVKGDPGAAGAQGPIGPEGPQGAAGTGINMKGTVPTAADLPSANMADGDAYVAEDTGNLWVWDAETTSWIDAGDIQGPAGPTGPQGVQGVQGVPGTPGATGPQGAKGDTGATGATGSQGPKGDPGAQGIQGATGPAGSPDTAAQVLAKLITVDGASSLLDADLLDGQHGAFYRDWANLTSKPATFPPSTHSHPQSEVTNLVTDLAGKASTVHSHTTAQVTGLDTALAGKEPTIATGPAGTFWANDKTWKTPAGGGEDDVLEYANVAAFPASGTAGLIYVAQDTNKIYRWSGTGDVTPPTITSATTFSAPENAAYDHTLTANETVTWSLTGGADVAQFSIVSGNKLRMAAQDFEAGTTKTVIVKATDTANNYAFQTITATITDVAEDVTPPTITSATTFSAPENAVYNHTLTANETVTWSVFGGPDAAQFSIVSGNILRMAAQDYEAAAARMVIVRATDTASNVTNQTITATITDVVEGINISTPSIELAAMSDTGLSSTDNITRINTPTFDIICATTPLVGDVLDLAKDGVLASSATLTATDIAGTSEPALPVGPLADGTYVFTARHKRGGDASAYSVGVSVTVDTTLPVLTAASGVQSGTTPGHATLSVTTNTGQGNIYWVVQPAAMAPPTTQQIIDGIRQDGFYAPAGHAGNFAVSATGAQTATATGFSATGDFKVYFTQYDVAGNVALLASSLLWTQTIASFTANGVGGFDGTTTYMTCTINPAGSIADGKQGIVSCWVKNLGGTGLRYFFAIATGSTVKLWAYINGSNALQINGRAAAGTDVLNLQSIGAGSPLISPDWVHCLIAWDLGAATPWGQIYLNGVSNQSGTKTLVNTAIGYAQTQASVGANPVGGQKITANLSELYVNLHETLDLTNPANVQKFIAGGLPVSLGATGTLPTGSQPEFYLGDDNTFANWGTNNGSKGNFATVGGPLTSVTGPP